MLFADLVGFTTLSEARDAEDVRELLSRYFETCSHADRALRRHGREVHRRRGDGGVGRAGRAGGRRRAGGAGRARPGRGGLGARARGRAPALRARAGVLTGEAAVTLGAEGRGHGGRRPGQHRLPHPVGAEPGTVLVGEATERATEAAIVYEDAGATS